MILNDDNDDNDLVDNNESDIDCSISLEFNDTRMQCEDEYHESGVEVLTQIIEKFKISKINKKNFSFYSSSSSYSVSTVLTKPCTFELRMRLLQYATTTQDRENQNCRN